MPITGTILSHGSSLLAALVPLASLLLPANNSQLSHQHHLSQAADSQMATTLVATTAAATTSGDNSTVAGNVASETNQTRKILMNVKRNSGLLQQFILPNSSLPGLQARVEYVMGWIERSIEHLPSFPRLHPQECVKRSICEAHNDPHKYGAIGFMLRLLFPASNAEAASGELDNSMEYKVINKYRHAAGFGLIKRLDNNGTSNLGVCREKYEDCLVSLLEVAKNLVDMFVR